MNLVAIGAHPDDIEVLVGGTLSKRARRGDSVVGIVVSQMCAGREVEARQAFSELGLDTPLHLGVHPEQLQVSRELVKTFDLVLDRFAPDIIFTHHYGDSHQEHRAVYHLVVAACRRRVTTSILLYERAFPGGNTHDPFHPQWFEPLTQEDMNAKARAIAKHVSQTPDLWKRQAIDTAKVWGALVGCKYAEAFEVLRYVCSNTD